MFYVLPLDLYLCHLSLVSVFTCTCSVAVLKTRCAISLFVAKPTTCLVRVFSVHHLSFSLRFHVYLLFASFFCYCVAFVHSSNCNISLSSCLLLAHAYISHHTIRLLYSLPMSCCVKLTTWWRLIHTFNFLTSWLFFHSDFVSIEVFHFQFCISRQLFYHCVPSLSPSTQRCQIYRWLALVYSLSLWCRFLCFSFKWLAASALFHCFSTIQ